MTLKERLFQDYVKTGQSGSFNSSQSLLKMQEKTLVSKIKKYFPKDKDIKILDLGCGYGAFIYFLRKLGYKNIKGVDISAQQIELAKKIGLDNITQENIIDYLRSSKEKYDFIILKDIIEHLSDDELNDLLSLVYENLNINGQVYIHVPNGSGIFGMKILYGDLTHIRAFTHKSLRQLLLLYEFQLFHVSEDKPLGYHLKGILRRIVWEVFTFPLRVLHKIETGENKIILSQNITVIAIKTV